MRATHALFGTPRIPCRVLGSCSRERPINSLQNAFLPLQTTAMDDELASCSDDDFESVSDCELPETSGVVSGTAVLGDSSSSASANAAADRRPANTARYATAPAAAVGRSPEPVARLDAFGMDQASSFSMDNLESCSDSEVDDLGAGGLTRGSSSGSTLSGAAAEPSPVQHRSARGEGETGAARGTAHGGSAPCRPAEEKEPGSAATITSRQFSPGGALAAIAPGISDDNDTTSALPSSTPRVVVAATPTSAPAAAPTTASTAAPAATPTAIPATLPATPGAAAAVTAARTPLRSTSGTSLRPSRLSAFSEEGSIDWDNAPSPGDMSMGDSGVFTPQPEASLEEFSVGGGEFSVGGGEDEYSGVEYSLGHSAQPASEPPTPAAAEGALPVPESVLRAGSTAAAAVLKTELTTLPVPLSAPRVAEAQADDPSPHDSGRRSQPQSPEAEEAHAAPAAADPAVTQAPKAAGALSSWAQSRLRLSNANVMSFSDSDDDAPVLFAAAPTPAVVPAASASTATAPATAATIPSAPTSPAPVPYPTSATVTVTATTATAATITAAITAEETDAAPGSKPASLGSEATRAGVGASPPPDPDPCPSSPELAGELVGVEDGLAGINEREGGGGREERRRLKKKK